MAAPEDVERSTAASTPRLGVREVYGLAVVVAVLFVLYVARSALAPFLLAFLGVYMLLPVVNAVERRLPDTGRWPRFRRPLAVLAAVAGTLIALGIVLTILVRPVVDQTVELFNNFGSYWDTISSEYPEAVDWYEDNVPEELRSRLETAVRDLGEQLVPGAAGLLTWLAGATGSLISALIAFVSVPLFVVYYLLEEPKTIKNLRRELPGRWTGDAISIFRIIDQIMGSYTRGVMLMSLIVGVITGFGYWAIGVDLWLPLAFIAFAGEIVPIIGPWIAFAISFPVVLATEPDLAIPAAILFLIIQALEGWFLAPKIEGKAVSFTSASTLFLLAIGGALAGALGVVFALPVAAIVRALIVYGAHRFDGCSPEDARSLLPIFDDGEPSQDIP